uniref:Uncharacterized protein n=1 Tax=Oryza sativa subsp. japonica TaxID=39947 RepID=Q6YVK2_ORYSJ|nr:hypothetical protein [Oryza sativa Japonica Group]BAD08063.1 hypothetical protein [Oryza sativa Japonica Group]
MDLDFGRLVDEGEEHDKDGVTVGVAVHHAEPVASPLPPLLLDMWSATAALIPRCRSTAALARRPLRPPPLYRGSPAGHGERNATRTYRCQLSGQYLASWTGARDRVDMRRVADLPYVGRRFGVALEMGDWEWERRVARCDFAAWTPQELFTVQLHPCARDSVWSRHSPRLLGEIVDGQNNVSAAVASRQAQKPVLGETLIPQIHWRPCFIKDLNSM